jgi:hypothetical protein
MFDVDVAGYHGVAPFGYGGTGIPRPVVLAVSEARRVQANFADGEVLQLPPPSKAKASP